MFLFSIQVVQRSCPLFTPKLFVLMLTTSKSLQVKQKINPNPKALKFKSEGVSGSVCSSESSSPFSVGSCSASFASFASGAWVDSSSSESSTNPSSDSDLWEIRRAIGLEGKGLFPNTGQIRTSQKYRRRRSSQGKQLCKLICRPTRCRRRIQTPNQ